MEALHVLECYRVLLLQRPPTLTALKDGNLDHRGRPGTKERHGFDDLAALMTLTGKPTCQGDGLAALAAVSCFAWFPSPHGPFGWREPSPWKTEFVEVALSRWIETQTGNEEPSMLLLYHLVHISLHSNLGLLQRLARLVTKSGRMPSNAKVYNSIERWLKSRHYAIAQWHAEGLLKVITLSKGGGSDRWNLGGQAFSTFQIKPRTLMLDTPHQPFCAYFATLVLWYGCLVPSQGQGRLQRNACITQGARILFDMKVRVARNLGNALYELMAEEDDS